MSSPRFPPGEDFGELDQSTRVQLGVGGIMAHRPEISQKLGELTNAINHSGTLSRRLIELIRLRIAFHNQCRSCMAIRYAEAVSDGVSEELVCSLEQPEEVGGSHAGRTRRAPLRRPVRDQPPRDRRRRLRRSPAVLQRGRARGDRAQLRDRRRRRPPGRDLGRDRRPAGAVPRPTARVVTPWGGESLVVP